MKKPIDLRKLGKGQCISRNQVAPALPSRTPPLTQTDSQVYENVFQTIAGMHPHLSAHDVAVEAQRHISRRQFARQLARNVGSTRRSGRGDPHRTPPPSPSRNVRARTTCTPVQRRRRSSRELRIAELQRTAHELQNYVGDMNRPPESPVELAARDELRAIFMEIERELEEERAEVEADIGERYSLFGNFPPPPPPPAAGTVGSGRKKKGKGAKHSVTFTPPEPAVPIASNQELLLNVRRRLSNLRRMHPTDLEESVAIEGSIRELEAEERRLISLISAEEEGYRIPPRKGKGSKTSSVSSHSWFTKTYFDRNKPKPFFEGRYKKGKAKEEKRMEGVERELMGQEDVKKGKGKKQSKVAPLETSLGIVPSLVPSPTSGAALQNIIREMEHEMALEKKRQHQEGRQMLHEDVRRAERIARQRELKLMGKEDTLSKLAKLPEKKREASERYFMEQEENYLK